MGVWRMVRGGIYCWCLLLCEGWGRVSRVGVGADPLQELHEGLRPDVLENRLVRPADVNGLLRIRSAATGQGGERPGRGDERWGWYLAWGWSGT